MTIDAIRQCHSCGHTYCEGKGISADWFCSERCRDWFDTGNPSHRQREEFVSKLYSRPLADRGISLGQIADTLEVSRRSIRNGCIQGKKGKILSDGSIQLEVSLRQLSAIKKKLTFLKEKSGLFYLQHELVEDEKPILRKAVGLKKKPVLDTEILAKLKNNLPTPIKTLSSCRNEGF